MRPADISTLTWDQVSLEDPARISRTAQKNLAEVHAFLDTGTVSALKLVQSASGAPGRVFPGRGAGWLGKLLNRTRIPGLCPRSFRVRIATLWPGDQLESLKLQAGWKTVSTPMNIYRKSVEEKHLTAFKKVQGIEDSDDEIPGYS